MDKRKLGIVLMLLAGLSLPISVFSSSWRIFEGKDKTEWGSLTRDATYRLTTGLRSATKVKCPRKGPCESKTVHYQWSLFDKASGKAYFVFLQITFWAGLLISAALLVGAWMLYARRGDSRLFLTALLVGTLVVLATAIFSIMDPGLYRGVTLHRAGFFGTGIGWAYLLFLGSCALALAGIGRAKRYDAA